MADRLVFPPAKAAQLPFPPGCSVSFRSSAAAASTLAVVQSAFIDLSSTDRTTNYEVFDALTFSATVVSEAQLRYAIDCPVRILGGSSSGDDGGGSGGSLSGVIISRPYGGDRPMYSVQVVDDKQREGEVIHSLTMECLQYRRPPSGKMLVDDTPPTSKEETEGEGDEMKVDGDDEQEEQQQEQQEQQNNVPTFAVPSEVIISTANSEQKIATDNNSVGGSMMFSGDDFSVHQDDGKEAPMNDRGDPEGDTMRIPRKAKNPRHEDKENGHPNLAAALVRNDTYDERSIGAKKMKMETHRVERLRVPSFISFMDIEELTPKLKQLGDETCTAVEIEVAEKGEIVASGGRHHDDGAVYIAVRAKDSRSDVHRCCWGVEDLLYESLPDCLRRPLLFDIMVCGEYGIVDASRVPWEGRTPFTNDPLVVYVERGPAFIRPKSWLGIVSIPSEDVGEGWRDLVYDMLLGQRGRKHQELLRQFPGSRISVEIRDDCLDFPHVSIESYGRETLIGAMHYVRGELTKIMKK